MANTGLEVLDRSIQKTHLWLKELLAELGWKDRRRAWSALRAVLHALRNRLTVDEAVQLGAEFPLVLRGLYFEGWDCSRNPAPDRTLDDFLQHIAEDLYRQPGVDPEHAARAVFRLLASRITSGELSDLTHTLPAPIRDLWPEATEEEEPPPQGKPSGRRRSARAFRQEVSRTRVIMRRSRK